MYKIFAILIFFGLCACQNSTQNEAPPAENFLEKAIAPEPTVKEVPQALKTPVCNRSLSVIEALMQQTGMPSCFGNNFTANILNQIQTLYISDLGLNGYGGYGKLESNDFSGLSNLRVLYIKYHNLSASSPTLFKYLKSLTHLYLNNNKINSLSSTLLENLNSLGILDLSNNGISHLSADTFNGLSSLKKLNLSRNIIGPPEEEIFPESYFIKRRDGKDLPANIFNQLSSLETLNLSENNLNSLEEGIFENLSSLKRLNLADNNITTLPANIFNQLSSLEILLIPGNNLSDEETNHIKEEGSNRNIQVKLEFTEYEKEQKLKEVMERAQRWADLKSNNR